MQAVTITQITPVELETIIENVLKRTLSSVKSSDSNSQARFGNATRKQAADYLGISLPTLHQHTIAGVIKGSRIGRRVLYRWQDLDAATNEIKTKKN